MLHGGYVIVCLCWFAWPFVYSLSQKFNDWILVKFSVLKLSWLHFCGQSWQHWHWQIIILRVLMCVWTGATRIIGLQGRRVLTSDKFQCGRFITRLSASVSTTLDSLPPALTKHTIRHDVSCVQGVPTFLPDDSPVQFLQIFFPPNLQQVGHFPVSHLLYNMSD